MILVVIFFTTLCIQFGCQKEDLNPRQQNSLICKSEGKPPEILEGMIVFPTLSDFNNYLNVLDEKLKNDQNSQMESSEILLAAENAIGFTSLRKVLQDEFDAKNEIGFASLEDVPDYPWLQDQLIRSVLSPDYAG